MKKITAIIPNAITCGNLLCGCIAIVFALEGNLVWAAYLVGIAAVLDFFDGFAARMLKVYSEMGKQLDSLADMVTFGVVPGIVMFKLMNYSLGNLYTASAGTSFLSVSPDYEQDYALYLPYLAFLISIFSALRLAKFNIDTRQSESFIGVPTPACTMLICSLPLILHEQGLLSGASGNHGLLGDLGNFIAGFSDTSNNPYSFLLNFYFLAGLSLLMSYLLVAELPLFALKFKHLAWKGNEVRYLFLISSLLMLVCFRYTGIPIIIILYVVLSLVNNLKSKVKS